MEVYSISVFSTSNSNWNINPCITEYTPIRLDCVSEFEHSNIAQAQNNKRLFISEI